MSASSTWKVEIDARAAKYTAPQFRQRIRGPFIAWTAEYVTVLAERCTKELRALDRPARVRIVRFLREPIAARILAERAGR